MTSEEAPDENEADPSTPEDRADAPTDGDEERRRRMVEELGSLVEDTPEGYNPGVWRHRIDVRPSPFGPNTPRNPRRGPIDSERQSEVEHLGYVADAPPEYDGPDAPAAPSDGRFALFPTIVPPIPATPSQFGDRVTVDGRQYYWDGVTWNEVGSRPLIGEYTREDDITIHNGEPWIFTDGTWWKQHTDTAQPSPHHYWNIAIGEWVETHDVEGPHRQAGTVADVNGPDVYVRVSPGGKVIPPWHESETEVSRADEGSTRSTTATTDDNQLPKRRVGSTKSTDRSWLVPILSVVVVAIGIGIAVSATRGGDDNAAPVTPSSGTATQVDETPQTTPSSTPTPTTVAQTDPPPADATSPIELPTPLFIVLSDDAQYPVWGLEDEDGSVTYILRSPQRGEGCLLVSYGGNDVDTLGECTISQIGTSQPATVLYTAADGSVAIELRDPNVVNLTDEIGFAQSAVIDVLDAPVVQRGDTLLIFGQEYAAN